MRASWAMDTCRPISMPPRLSRYTPRFTIVPSPTFRRPTWKKRMPPCSVAVFAMS
jgi:hypothetical protein